MTKKVASKPTLFDDEPPLPAPIPESPLTKDLCEADKAEFSRLLRQKMSLEERATQPVLLANKQCTKTAAVGLRAIQEINAITGVKDDKPNEAVALFQLPPNTAVAIKVLEPGE